MSDETRPDPTETLAALRDGDEAAAARLLPLVYEELRRLAGSRLRRERPDHTLQPTALVHEAWLRLVDQTRADLSGRTHFLAVASEAIRRVLVDHARRHKALKRGGGARPTMTLDEAVAPTADRELDVLAVDGALRRLAGLDARKARVVELRLFAGLTHAQTAEALGVSATTVEGDWRVARAWLRAELGPEAAS